MNTTYRNFIHRVAAALLMTSGLVTVAHAEHNANSRVTLPSNAQWESECGACHVLYSPRMLPAESWRAVMSGLGSHFGADASLDVTATQEIGSFLERNAGRGKSAATDKPVLRITETRWFVREHRKLSSKVWTSDLVKSPANCTACHAQAPGGSYSERNVKVPQ